MILANMRNGEQAMTAMGQHDWHEQADDPQVRIDGRVDPVLEDAYWQSVFWGEPYYRSDCSYEDYAPAYCVGYIGYAQYGGSYEDAEKSLCANWLRIKGDSRLGLEEALQAIRAAWDRAGRRAAQPQEEDEELAEPSYATPLPAREPAYAAA
jgi:hypothetical protein